MELGEHVHWFITDRCNQECSYCFKPDTHYEESVERLEALSRILVKNNVKKVTIGGGEPTLVKGLDNTLKILKQGEIHVSLHTNATLLDDKRISELLVDDIAIAVDSKDESTQKELRGREFIPTFHKIPHIAKTIQENNIGLEYHTVFTALNHKDIPSIYDMLRETGFQCWRIYEFNYELARTRLLSASIKDHETLDKVITRLKKMEDLNGHGTPEKGYTDCLLANFLLMEEKMMEYNDKRIQFIGIRDYSAVKPAYTFLDNSGDISFYTWFSGRERRVLGNILKQEFSLVIEKLKQVDEQGLDFDDKAQDEFIEAITDKPIWARLYDGNYCYEEIDEIDKRFLDHVERLEKLYLDREAKVHV